MNEDILTQTFLEMQKSLGSIDSKLETLCEVIKDHAIRIQKLENSQTAGSIGLKDDIIRFSLKAIIGLISVVVALTGAGGILQKIMQ